MIFFLALLLVQLTSGKVYERCELARELQYVHKAPNHQLATWVCIAEHESQYNTSIVGHLNGDGSGDHGIFQISDKFWCSPPGKGYACGVTCAELEDDDIADDFSCAQMIYKEHKTLSGDGFNAWAVYTPHCKGAKAERYLKGCFNDSEGSKEVIADRQETPHRFFSRAKVIPPSSPTFDAFFTPTTSPFVTPSTFYNPPTSRTTAFVPSTRANSFFSTSSQPTRANSFFSTSSQPSSNLVFFNPPSTVSTFAPFPSRSSIFGSSRTTSVFTSTTPRTTAVSVVVNEPVFIFNGVKWY